MAAEYLSPPPTSGHSQAGPPRLERPQNAAVLPHKSMKVLCSVLCFTTQSTVLSYCRWDTPPLQLRPSSYSPPLESALTSLPVFSSDGGRVYHSPARITLPDSLCAIQASAACSNDIILMTREREDGFPARRVAHIVVGIPETPGGYSADSESLAASGAAGRIASTNSHHIPLAGGPHHAGPKSRRQAKALRTSRRSAR